MNWNALLTTLCVLLVAAVLPFVLLHHFRNKKSSEGLTNYRDEGLRAFFECFFRKGIMCTCRHINKVGRLNCEKCGGNLINARGFLYSMIFFVGLLVVALGLIDNETSYVLVGGVLIFLSVAGAVFLTGYKNWAIRMAESAIGDTMQFSSEQEVEAVEYVQGDMLAPSGKNIKRMTRNEIIQEMKVFTGEAPGDFYVGVTKNPIQTKNLHSVETNWKHYKMWNNESARTIEDAFKKFGCKTGNSAADANSVYVYIYKVTSKTREQLDSIGV